MNTMRLYQPSDRPLSLSLHSPIRKCRHAIERIMLPKPISVSSFKLIIEQMFDHWKQVAYFDNENSVFPSDDLLDHLEIHETSSRRIMTGILSTLADDFNAVLIENDIFDWFYANCYRQVLVNKDALLFV